MASTHLQAIRVRNRLNILDAVRRQEPVSRREVVRTTGLASTTVADIANELIDLGLVTEHSLHLRGKGRPSTGLRLNKRAALVAACTLHPPAWIELKIADLSGALLFTGSAKFSAGPMDASFAHAIADAIASILAASPYSKGAIHSVGLALAGVVDSQAGVLHWAPPNPPAPFPLAQLVGTRLNLPVVIDTIPNAMARAERWFGDGRDCDDFSLITMDFGIGLSCYVDGKLWHGTGGVSPEIAHVKVPVREPASCICGARGCLVTEAGIVGMVRKIDALRAQPSTPFDKVIENFHLYAQEARAGNELCREVFRAGGEALGVALANHINLWSPRRIILLSLTPVVAELLRDPMLKSMQANLLPFHHGRTEILFKNYDEALMAQCAAAVALERLTAG
jgi:predicted NBD/HSP70 family sugar kinase